MFIENEIEIVPHNTYYVLEGLEQYASSLALVIAEFRHVSQRDAQDLEQRLDECAASASSLQRWNSRPRVLGSSVLCFSMLRMFHLGMTMVV